jgi:hypothetical protein
MVPPPSDCPVSLFIDMCVRRTVGHSGKYNIPMATIKVKLIFGPFSVLSHNRPLPDPMYQPLRLGIAEGAFVTSR